MITNPCNKKLAVYKKRAVEKAFSPFQYFQYSNISMTYIAWKIKFPIKDFFSKCGQIRMKQWIWSHLRKKFLMKNFIFCAVLLTNFIKKATIYLVKFSGFLLSFTMSLTQRKNCPYSELFWCVFSRILLKTERYSVSFCIQSESGKIPTRITLNMENFYAVLMYQYSSDQNYWKNRNTENDEMAFLEDLLS